MGLEAAVVCQVRFENLQSKSNRWLTRYRHVCDDEHDEGFRRRTRRPGKAVVNCGLVQDRTGPQILLCMHSRGVRVWTLEHARVLPGEERLIVEEHLRRNTQSTLRRMKDTHVRKVFTFSLSTTELELRAERGTNTNTLSEAYKPVRCFARIRTAHLACYLRGSNSPLAHNLLPQVSAAMDKVSEHSLAHPIRCHEPR